MNICAGLFVLGLLILLLYKIFFDKAKWTVSGDQDM